MHWQHICTHVLSVKCSHLHAQMHVGCFQWTMWSINLACSHLERVSLPIIVGRVGGPGLEWSTHLAPGLFLNRPHLRFSSPFRGCWVGACSHIHPVDEACWYHNPVDGLGGFHGSLSLLNSCWLGVAFPQAPGPLRPLGGARVDAPPIAKTTGLLGPRVDNRLLTADIFSGLDNLVILLLAWGVIVMGFWWMETGCAMQLLVHSSSWCEDVVLSQLSFFGWLWVAIMMFKQ